MVERSEFHGDVGQAVIGNVNEAPQLKNVVQLNLGGKDAKPPAITDLQRRKIAAKVKEVMALGNLKQLDVYGVVLTELNAEKIAELPRDSFKDAIELLDQWIAKLQPDNKGVPVAHGDEVKSMTVSPRIRCEDVHRQTRQAQIMMLVQTIAMVLLTAVTSWLLWLKPGAATASTETHCHYDGKSYSIGSAVKMINGELRECARGSGSDASHWSTQRRR